MPPIYEKSVRELMRDYANSQLAPGKVISRNDVLAWFAEHYPKIKKATVNAHIVTLSTNAPSRVHYKARTDGSDDCFFLVDSSHLRLYDPTRDPAPIYTFEEARAAMGKRPEPVGLDEDEDDDPRETGSSTFAYERDLREYLARNLQVIDRSLRLYNDQENGISGIEFPVGGRFVDILAVDDRDTLVVIELKVSRGYDRVVGQLLRYMGWIGAHLAENGQQVRGIIIANRITEDLVFACARVPDIQLFEYELAVRVRKVDAAP